MDVCGVRVTRNVGLLVVGILTVVTATVYFMYVSNRPPDFAALSLAERKTAFVSYLCPAINHANDLVLQDRQQLATGGAMLVELASKYGLSTNVEQDLLHERAQMRIHALPAALVLAQAAIESGWGTSQLAQSAHNYFGRKCFYVDDCYEGDDGQLYRAFDSVEAAVALYFRDINVLMPYVELRRLRRAHGPEAAHRLANGLRNYSSKGQQYVDQVVKVMRENEAVLSCDNYAV